MDYYSIAALDAEGIETMIHKFEAFFYYLKIKLLLALNPAALFHQINQLDWYRKTLQQWVDAHHFDFNCKILEVGCATGELSAYLSESAYAAIGVDASEAMIQAAKSYNPDGEYQIADALNLPFEDGAFDAVISASLINIVEDPQTAFDEMYRVCKTGGVISMLVPVQGFNDVDLEHLIYALEVTGFSEAALKAWHTSAPKMQIHDIEVLLKKAGMEMASSVRYLQGMVLSVSAIKLM